ncbi:MAG TPA: phospho-N-acetylmuramoyl-pentapeptide-transferase [Candidatus Obscuribacterales bacterium]
MPCLAAFAVGLLGMPPYIRWLKHLQIEQYLREEGPKSHASKARTPTMGGVCFIAAIVLSLFGWWIASSTTSIDGVLVLGTAALCALVGFVDDFAKVTNKSNKGVSARVRLIVEGLLGLLLAIGLLLTAQEMGRIIICLVPADGGGTEQLLVPRALLPSWAFCLLSIFLVAATTNAVNLHDGMDGLAAGTSAQVFATLAALLYETHQFTYSAIAAATAGGIISFLVFNKHPARIFMGDTGSLFIGGLMASLVIAGGLLLWFVPLSVLYIAETISVMSQVVYFKLTKEYTPEKPMSTLALTWLKLTKRLPGEGRRLFRMAPLHHHFEAVFAEKNVGEGVVVLGFWILQFFLCASVLLVFYCLKAS